MLIGRFVTDGGDAVAATVILSQTGNILLFCGSAATAWLILGG
jgi:hypothetical protein